MRRAVAAVLAGTAATVVLALAAAPAQAGPDRLQISHDGLSWGRTLTKPLFDDVGGLVPKDLVADGFYVRNNTDQAARATVTVVTGTAANPLERALRLHTLVGGTAASAPVGAASVCASVVTGPSISPGATQRIGLALEMPDLHGRATMGRTADIDLLVTLTEVGSSGAVDVCGVQAAADGPPEPGDEPGEPAGAGHHPGSGSVDPAEPCRQAGTVPVAVVGHGPCTRDEAGADTTGDVPGPAARPGALADTGAPRGALTIALLATGLLATGSGMLLARRRTRTSVQEPAP